MSAIGSMQDIQKLLRRLNNGDEEVAAQLQPTIIANHNIDPTEVESWWSGYCNDAWAPQIDEKIQQGYIAIRVQTEFGINGHSTMIYMVKMKP